MILPERVLADVVAEVLDDLVTGVHGVAGENEERDDDHPARPPGPRRRFGSGGVGHQDGFDLDGAERRRPLAASGWTKTERARRDRRDRIRHQCEGVCVH
jgi:hypothetical protein